MYVFIYECKLRINFGIRFKKNKKHSIKIIGDGTSAHRRSTIIIGLANAADITISSTFCSTSVAIIDTT